MSVVNPSLLDISTGDASSLQLPAAAAASTTTSLNSDTRLSPHLDIVMPAPTSQGLDSDAFVDFKQTLTSLYEICNNKTFFTERVVSFGTSWTKSVFLQLL